MVPDDLLQLLEVLKYSLEEAWFGFVSDEIEHVIEESIGPRSRLLALRNCPQARSGYANFGKFNVIKSIELKKQSRCISAPSLTPTNLGMFYYDPLRLRSRGGLCACTILLCFSSTAPATGSNEAAKAVMPSA